MRAARRLGLAVAVLLAAFPLRAQDDSSMPMPMHSMEGMEMSGMYGPWSMNRDASGTSWQPEATPHDGLHAMSGEWMTMLHGYVNAVYDHQGGDRGGEKTFSSSMLMAAAWRPLGGGTVGLRGMLSLDPAMGASGYPLLLQTGETADGATPLVDRQHPHDFFSELAVSYSRPIGSEGSAFAYLGLPGEPALGPPAFVHRFSGQDIPEAPIAHHWLDSTHITFGVATLGAAWQNWKLEGSAFKGREPDQYRWDIDTPKLDSWSTRLSWNPTPHWALQVSRGRLHSPEELTPSVNQDRTTASAMVGGDWAGNPWQTTAAWGQNSERPGKTLNAFLIEGTLRLQETHTIFGRAERVEKNDLLPTGETLAVYKLSLGYLHDFLRWEHSQWGLGGLASLYGLPSGLTSSYGNTPLSFMLFIRAKLI